jgi:hypothetical protein
MMNEMLNAMTLEQLNALILTVQELTEAKKATQRRDEIMAELTDLFAELDELGIEYYFGAPARNGGTDCYIITGDVVLDEDAVIIY